MAHKTGALSTRDLARITVDTTVQAKNVTHPTDAKLLLKAITELGKLAKRHGVRLRQSYVRVAKQAALMAGRYAHAKSLPAIQELVLGPALGRTRGTVTRWRR